MVKSKDSSGYLLVTDNTLTTRIMDVSAGLSIVGTFDHPLGHPNKFIAGSSIDVQEFAIVDISAGDDVDRVILQGITATYHERIVSICVGGMWRIKAVNTTGHYVGGCHEFGLVIFHLQNQTIDRVLNTTTQLYDLVLYDNYRLVSFVAYESDPAIQKYGYFNFRLTNYEACHPSCGSCDMKISADGCTSCPPNFVQSALPEGTCTACGPTTHWVNGLTCEPCHTECTGCNADGTC